jgi:hypothetical protein
MAKEKKASSKKTVVGKKASVVKKSVKKVKKKSLAAQGLVLAVPIGGQVIGTFVLTPSLPVDGQASSWALVDTSTGEDVSSIQVSFSVESSDVQREFERAVLVVDLAEGIDNESGYWRFVLNGVEPSQRTGDVEHDVLTGISNQGRTLTAVIHAVDLGHEQINYGYVASFTNAISGVVSIYESKDPGIGIGRP